MLKKFWIAFKLIPFIPLILMFADFIDKKEYLLLTASALAGIYVYKETFQNINYFITGLVYRIKSLITGLFSFLFKIIIFIPKGTIKIFSLGKQFNNSTYKSTNEEKNQTKVKIIRIIKKN